MKLEPCPECGAKTTIASDIDDEHFVVCLLRGGHWCGPTCSTEEQAAEAWNGPAGLWALGPEIMTKVTQVINHFEDVKCHEGYLCAFRNLLAKLEALGIKE